MILTPPKRRQTGRIAIKSAPVEDRLTAIEKRKRTFDALNHFVTIRNGWITSVPGDTEIMVETLPESGIPAGLIEMGYDVEEIEPGQRILPAGITEMVVTEGSTVPMKVTHAGIVATRRWRLLIS